jgi:hypothetical protein
MSEPKNLRIPPSPEAGLSAGKARQVMAFRLLQAGHNQPSFVLFWYGCMRRRPCGTLLFSSQQDYLA